MNTPLQPDSTLADLAVTFPAASRVFRRYGLD
jgi:iron-sulfur cluster repair protein YtfE (RIC family)